ncbi:MAG: hypothetical protein ACRDIV_18690 [Ktedonobacteraceae bacterium]
MEPSTINYETPVQELHFAPSRAGAEPPASILISPMRNIMG